MCLYDAGGIDTLDLSGYNTVSKIDLNAGAFSDCNDMTKNISIAYTTVIENAVSGGGNDTLIGNSVANTLNGGAGNDTFNGGGGGDTFIGGTGTDTVTYTSEIASLTIDMLTSANGTGNAQGDTFNSIESVIGSGFNDTISGTNGNETIDGGAGNDILNGRSGNDAIIGGAGTDTAIFAGNFSAFAFNYNAVTSIYTVYNPDGSIDTVTGVENFQFTDGTKTAVQLPITTGVPQRHVTITNLTLSQNEGNSGTTTYTFDVHLDGSDYSSQTVNYTIAGNGMNPANAADFTGALSGTLTFAPGETVKTVTVSVVGDTTLEQNETFVLTLTTPSTGLVIDTPTSTSTIVNDDAPPVNIINGTAAGETLIGTTGVDQINGLDGNDILVGGAGADALNGGNGNDIASYSNATSAVVADLGLPASNTGDAAGDTYVGIEGLTGSAFNDQLLGLDTADTLDGGDGNDLLWARGGDDILIGGNGNDSLYGLDGNDILNGGAGNDYMAGGTGNDRFIFAADFGKDAISDFQAGIGVSDIIELSLGTAFDTYNEVMAAATQVGSDTVIMIDANNSITLTGVLISSLVADDFSFV